jgi:hypothetical protein
MADKIDGKCFRDAMAREGVNAKQLQRLAKRGGQNISLRAISRYRESGTHGVRAGTVLVLAEVLKTDPDYLRGIKSRDSEEVVSPLLNETRWKVRMPMAIRNSYQLAAWRYRVPVSCILELGPLLFEVFAEQCQTERKLRLSQLRAAYDARLSLRPHVQHLPIRASADGTAEAIFHAEEASIEQRDLFGELLWKDARVRDETFDSDFDDDQRNPFAAFLLGLVADLGCRIEVEGISMTEARYKIGSDLALALAGGDEDLAASILDGSIPLHELQQNLISREAAEARVAWLRARAEEHAVKLRKELPDIFSDIALSAGDPT